MAWSICILKVLLLVIGCLPTNTEGRKKNPPCPLKNPFVPFKVLTFNTVLHDNAWTAKGLSTLENNRIERRNALIEYMKTTDADVLCFQEVFIGRDVEAIVNGLSAQFPHSQSQLHLFNGILPSQSTGLREPVCDATVVQDLSVCIVTFSCSLSSGMTGFADCLSKNCLNKLLKTYDTGRSRCVTCLINGLPANIASCIATDPPTDNWDMNPMGLVLLSKQPMTNRLIVPYYQGVPMALQRGYLQATIDGEITVACSHTSFSDAHTIEEIQHLSVYGNTNQCTTTTTTTSISSAKLSQFIANGNLQNDYEVSDLIRRFKNQEALVLLGDLNVGRSGKHVKPYNEDNFQRLVGVFNTNTVSECTYCSLNPYNVHTTTDVDVSIDHIFASKPLTITEAQVVLKVKDASVQAGGSAYPLSDHYGVKATVTCGKPAKQPKTRGRKRTHRKKHA